MLAGRLRPMAMPRGDYPLDAPPVNRTVLIYAAEDELLPAGLRAVHGA